MGRSLRIDTEKPKPAYDAFAVDGHGENRRRLAARNGHGYNVQLGALPVNGRIALRVLKERESPKAKVREAKK